MASADPSDADDILTLRIPAARKLPNPAARTDRGPDPRILRTRAAVAEAATTLFLHKGYQATSVDDIAALAGVSKRSIYNNFGDKETLFTEIVLGACGTAEAFADQLIADLADTRDVRTALRTLAHRHITTVARPPVLRLRRLIILEAARFPKLAAEYRRRAPDRVITALTEAFRTLHARGELETPDPLRAAQHYSFLVLGATLDAMLFDPDGPLPTTAEREQIADDGVRAFLAAYRPRRDRKRK
ncbi:TetR/AcrR family transcriptional regulator [Actinocatenispora rupis]|nr:TetR/AcrR family transcriptional regulator [Actinocatenispora rupis]